jgi:hypothetical protein
LLIDSGVNLVGRTPRRVSSLHSITCTNTPCSTAPKSSSL